MDSGTAWTLVAVLTLVSIVIRGAGPVALGGRELPAAGTRIVAMLAPALMTALVAVAALTVDGHVRVGAVTAGVAVAALVAARGGGVLLAVTIAAIVTALLRLL